MKTSLVFVIAALIGLVCFSEAYSLKNQSEHGQRSFEEVLVAKLVGDNLEKLKAKYGVTSIEELQALFAEKFPNLNKFPGLMKPVPTKAPLEVRSDLANDDQDSEEDEDDEDSSEEDEDYLDEDDENSRIAEKKSDENGALSDEDYSNDDFSNYDYSEEDEDDSNEAGEDNDFDDDGKENDE